MLAQRVAAAAVAIPVLLVLIWVGGWPYTVAAALLLAVAGAEFAHLKAPWLTLWTAFAAAYAALLAVTSFTIGPAPVILLTAALVVSSLPALYLWLRRGSEFSERISWLVLGVVYVGVLGSTIVLLREIDRVTVVTFLSDGTTRITTEDGGGRDWVFLALASTFAVDTAAYFTGRAIGRHKLAPAISPKKTWEGFFGGYAAGFAVVLALAALLDIDATTSALVVIAFCLPILATAGDLFESWLKRRAGVKDASDLIPGHGGLLDRFDSILFTFPLVFAVARWWA